MQHIGNNQFQEQIPKYTVTNIKANIDNPNTRNKFYATKKQRVIKAPSENLTYTCEQNFSATKPTLNSQERNEQFTTQNPSAHLSIKVVFWISPSTGE